MASCKAGNIPRIARNGRAGLPQFVVRTKGSGNQLCEACRLREPRVDEGRPDDRRYLLLGSRTPRPGAYSHVARRVGAAFAEEMMLGRRIYTAEEMKDVDLVHILAEPRQGIALLGRRGVEKKTGKSGFASASSRFCVQSVTS